MGQPAWVSLRQPRARVCASEPGDGLAGHLRIQHGARATAQTKPRHSSPLARLVSFVWAVVPAMVGFVLFAFALDLWMLFYHRKQVCTRRTEDRNARGGEGDDSFARSLGPVLQGRFIATRG